MDILVSWMCARELDTWLTKMVLRGLLCQGFYSLSAHLSQSQRKIYWQNLKISPESPGQFQPNLARSIIGWRKFKSVQIKGPALFQGEITKQQKFINKIFKNYSRTTRPSSAKLSIKHPWLNEIQVCSNEGHHPFPRGDNNSENTLTTFFK